jgi:hypothetical protein
MNNSTHCVYVTEKGNITQVIGGLNEFIAYAESQYNIENAGTANTALFETNARLTTSNLLVATGRPIAYIDFIDGAPVRTARSPEYGKIIIEL